MPFSFSRQTGISCGADVRAGASPSDRLMWVATRSSPPIEGHPTGLLGPWQQPGPSITTHGGYLWNPEFICRVVFGSQQVSLL